MLSGRIPAILKSSMEEGLCEILHESKARPEILYLARVGEETPGGRPTVGSDVLKESSTNNSSASRSEGKGTSLLQVRDWSVSSQRRMQRLCKTGVRNKLDQPCEKLVSKT